MPPFFSDPDNPFIRTATAAAAEVEGRDVPVQPMPAWFDGAHLARHLKIPVLSMGRGAPGTAHTAVEYVDVKELLRGAQAVALAVVAVLLSTRRDPATGYMVTAAATLLLAPLMWDHYLSLLMLPAAFLFERGRRWGILLPLCSWAVAPLMPLVAIAALLLPFSAKGLPASDRAV